MRTMSAEERRRFLSHGTRTGQLATVRAAGAPHVVPIWFVLDGDDLVFNTGADTVKGRNLRRDPRVCISVDDQAPPYSFVQINGVASLSEDVEAMLPWSTAIAARYMGRGRAEEYGRRNAVPGELLVRVTPARIVAVFGMAE